MDDEYLVPVSSISLKIDTPHAIDSEGYAIDSEGESEEHMRSERESEEHMRPEITQVYRCRSSDDSSAPPASSITPQTSTTLPSSGNTAPLPPDNDLDIHIALRRTSRTCKSNYRILM